MKFYFDNVKAKGTHEEELKTSGQDKSFNLYEGKEYRVDVKCDSKRNFTSLSFSFGWNDENVIPNFNGEALDFEIGNEFKTQGYTVIAEKVTDENRIVVSIDSNSDVNVVGILSLLSFMFTVKVKDFDIFLFIEVQDIK